jgi:DNA (cytosine-5)-methyltransferase 1
VRQQISIGAEELIVDMFAGGGGTSTGIVEALGRDPDIAINHSAEAIAVHAANHPRTKHYREDVWRVDPHEACQGRPVGLLWLSPDCKHHSRAKGGKPRDKKIRGLAWVATRWAQAVRPRVICLENVEEFQTWGPLDAAGYPNKALAGRTFRAFVGKLRRYGYSVEWRSLVAADYGAPTTRRRLFLVARCDGAPIAWPAPTHGKSRTPWRAAAEIIDWSLECPSIFERKKPLADATMRRIFEGLRRYVIEAPDPFIVPLTHHDTSFRNRSIHDPLPTITAAHRGELALVEPYLVRTAHGDVDKNGKRRGRGQHSLDEPMPTVLASKDFAVVAPVLASHYGESVGRPIDKPVPTVTAGGGGHQSVVAAFIAKHYGGPNGHQTPGQEPTKPLGSITGRDHHAVTAAFLTKFYSTNIGSDARNPLPTVTANGRGGGHLAEVRAFLVGYYSQGGSQRQPVTEPLRTVTAKARFGLVEVHGEPYQIVDIGMRMLSPRELFSAQGFPRDYVIDPVFKHKPLTKTAQISCAGNSVPPALAAAVVGAQFGTRNAEAA